MLYTMYHTCINIRVQVVTLLRGVVQAAEELAKEGISAEVRGNGCVYAFKRIAHVLAFLMVGTAGCRNSPI